MILLLNICKEKLYYLEFVKPLEEILLKNKIEFYTKHYTKFDDKDLKADKIIICGTSLRDNDFLEKIDVFKWLKFYKGKILGICGGMEILLYFYGGDIQDNVEIGEINVKFEKDFLNLKKEDKIKVYSLHSKIVEFDEEGKYFEIYAKSDNCIQAIKHKYKEFYGVMFHPEVRNRDIILEFCKL